MPEIDDDLLRRLAGPAAFERGRAYFHDGHVDDLNLKGGIATARVTGSQIYRVRLKQTASLFEGGCDCPASEGIDFCKHCVATALAWREALQQEHQLRTKGVKDRLPAYLLTLDKQALVDLLLEQLKGDRKALTRLQLKADIAAGKLNEKALKKQITAALPLGRHLHSYPQVRNYFAVVDAMLDNIAPLLPDLPPPKALALVDYAMERITRALGTVDDSGGFRLPALERLGTWHLQLLSTAEMAPEAMADYLYTLFSSDSYDFYPEIPDAYLGQLGEQGQLRFFERLQTAWDELPPLQARDWSSGSVYGHLQAPLLRRAQEQGAGPTVIGLYAKTATEFHELLSLSKICLDYGQVDQALWWRKRAQQAATKPYNREDALAQNQIDIWLHQKNYADAAELCWSRFSSSPGVDLYQAIVDIPGQHDDAPTRERALAAATALIAKRRKDDYWRASHVGALAQLHLHFNQPQQALALAEVEPTPRDQLVVIASANRDQPQRALALISRAAAAFIGDGNNRGYQAAIAALKEGEVIAGEGYAAEFRHLLQSLLEQYRRKRNFSAGLRQAFQLP